jgi:pimeloyl-ACP methyl ester carboxylesterase
MLAPAIDPDREKYFWFGKLGKWRATRWLIPKAFRVAADEKYSHESDLRSYQERWKDIKTDIVHVHGDKDFVVPFGNLEFSKKNINPDYLTPYAWKGMNHFFPFQKKEETLKLLDGFLTIKQE